MIKWSILVPTMPSRRVLRRRLLTVLEPQLEGYDDIELLILEDNCKRNYGSKLQSMIDIAQGEYVNFIDDDDLVASNYVEALYPLLDGVDCVGFTGSISINEGEFNPVYYSKKYTKPTEKNGAYYRHVQQLNPIKRELVKQIPYDGHFGADITWGDKMVEAGLLKTENKTNKTIYFYLADTLHEREVWDE